MIGEGDELAVRLTLGYKQASSGKYISFSSISILQLIEGKIAEDWEVIIAD